MIRFRCGFSIDDDDPEGRDLFFFSYVVETGLPYCSGSGGKVFRIRPVPLSLLSPRPARLAAYCSSRTIDMTPRMAAEGEQSRDSSSLSPPLDGFIRFVITRGKMMVT